MSESVRTLAVVAGILNVALLTFVLAFPVLDLPYTWIVASGSSAYAAYSVVWWFILAFSAFNLILPLILLAVVSGPEHPSRIDLHSIWSVCAVIVNFVCALFFGFIYFAWVNTSYSGAWPFNDVRWCCVYYNNHPELCPNTGPCTPHVTDEMLETPTALYVFLVFTAIMLLFAFVHLGLNRLLRISAPFVREKRSEGKLFGVIVALVYVAVFCYWGAIPLWDTIFTHGFPLFAIPPSPGPYFSSLGNWQWWFLWLVSFNIIPPVVFLMAVAAKKNHLVTAAHYWLSVGVSLVSTVAFIVLLGILLFDCNWGYAGGSICNDYRWCCSHFASAPNYCPNVTPCDASLFPNPQFLQHLVVSLVFSVFALVEVWVNIRMQQYGIFQ